ncbi:MAG: nickel-dependent lactate racemase, partial [bacterium]|nr:nickel-dependent lactate racemase [bacterium]
RPLSDEEFRHALGSWYGKVRTENHDAHAQDRLVPLGTTSLGIEIQINRTFAEAELKVLTGDVEHHQFCGYSGGAKSIYPGLANADAIRQNHSRMDLPGTGPGTLDENPVRREIDEVGRMAGIDFLLAVVLNGEHQIVSVHAGNWLRAFRNACPEVDSIYRVSLPGQADLVIASPGGHPKDATLYQAQKALRVAAGAVRPGGAIILAAECGEGSGSELFENWMEEAFEPEEIVTRIRKSFVMGGHKAYQIVRELSRATVYLYSTIPPGKVRSWFMHPVRALEDVERLIAGANSVSVLPRASSTLAEVESGVRSNGL